MVRPNLTAIRQELLSEIEPPFLEEGERYRIVRDSEGNVFCIHFVKDFRALRRVKENGVIEWNFDVKLSMRLQTEVLDILRESDLGVELRQLLHDGSGRSEVRPLTQKQTG